MRFVSTHCDTELSLPPLPKSNWHSVARLTPTSIASTRSWNGLFSWHLILIHCRWILQFLLGLVNLLKARIIKGIWLKLQECLKCSKDFIRPISIESTYDYFLARQPDLIIPFFKGILMPLGLTISFSKKKPRIPTLSVKALHTFQMHTAPFLRPMNFSKEEKSKISSLIQMTSVQS